MKDVKGYLTRVSTCSQQTVSDCRLTLVKGTSFKVRVVVVRNKGWPATAMCGRHPKIYMKPKTNLVERHQSGLGSTKESVAIDGNVTYGTSAVRIRKENQFEVMHAKHSTAELDRIEQKRREQTCARHITM
jgi:hypothetical protein